MLILKPLSIDWSVAGARIPAVTFIAQAGLPTRELAHMLDSLVRVSRREKQNHFVPQSQNRHSEPSAVPNPAQQHWPQRPVRKRKGKYDTACTGLVRFLFSKFRYSLTLFSKFFASFPHGTCALSVSHQYLALDGIYHPLCAAIPNNTTQSCKLQSTAERESHPLCCPVPRDFGQAILQTHHNSSVWAVPASLAVTGGILVSFFSSA